MIDPAYNQAVADVAAQQGVTIHSGGYGEADDTHIPFIKRQSDEELQEAMDNDRFKPSCGLVALISSAIVVVTVKASIVAWEILQRHGGVK